METHVLAEAAAVSEMLVRRVRVVRGRTPKQVLAATDRKQYTDDVAVASMSQCEGDDVDVYFFKLGRGISGADLVKEYELRGLKPDPYAQAAVNEADPEFADGHPNGSQWEDADGNYYYAIFDLWRDERCVLCSRRGLTWRDDCWFAGVRKYP